MEETMQEKRTILFVTLLTLLIMLVSCSNPGLQQRAATPGGESDSSRGYIHGDNVAPSQQPPGGHRVDEVPQFVVLGFDDNNSVAGMRWVTDLLKTKFNPAGSGNRYTYDGQPIKAAFYHPALHLRANIFEWYRAAQDGFEVGCHTDSHPHGANLSQSRWYDEIFTGTRKLIFPYKSGLGVGYENVYGFRAPYLEYNLATFQALKSAALRYDCSIEEGWQAEQDGTNHFWPYTLDNGAPGDPAITGIKAIWEIPVYVLTVPPDSKCAAYGIPAGLRAKLEALKPGRFSALDGKITGYDSELFNEFALTNSEALAVLKYSLDLKLKGNRAPFTLGSDAANYSSPERQAVLREFIDYALSKKDVRIVSGKQLYNWLRMPISLIEKPDVVAPTVPTGLKVGKTTGQTIELSWEASHDDRKVLGYYLYRDRVRVGSTGRTQFQYNYLTPATTYELAVSAYDYAGNESAMAIISAKTTNNHPPTVQIISPEQDIVVKEGDRLTFKAAAADNTGAITGVSYSISRGYGENFIGSATTAPYEVEWVPGGSGTFILTATAYDSEGLKSKSNEIKITVEPLLECKYPQWKPGVYTNETVCHNGRHWRAQWWTSDEPGRVKHDSWVEGMACPFVSGNQPPLLKLINPVEGVNYEPSQPMELQVDVTDDLGISRVIYYVDGMKIAPPIYKPPYSLSWIPKRWGSFRIRAEAYDIKGVSVLVEKRISIFGKPAIPPHTDITYPIEGEFFRPGSSIRIDAKLISNYPMDELRFYQGDILIGKAGSEPYSILWENVPAGSYKLKAVAYHKNGGEFSIHNTVNITVTNDPAADFGWKDGVSYKIGDLVYYNGRKWICIKEHLSNVAWYPGAAGLWFWEERS